MKVIFLGYRDWAIDAFKELKNKKIKKKIIINNKKKLRAFDLSKYDLLITLGWSSNLNKKILNNIETIGLHCAKRDRYSYGSPIQNQIIDGLESTKHRVFPFRENKNLNRIHVTTREYSHEVTLSLKGNINKIFENLKKTSIVLINKYLNQYPNIKYKKWSKEKIIRKKRLPKDSLITTNDLKKKNLRSIYNKIRCLGDPYPNAYFEDKSGVLLLKQVRFEKK